MTAALRLLDRALSGLGFLDPIIKCSVPNSNVAHVSSQAPRHCTGLACAHNSRPFERVSPMQQARLCYSSKDCIPCLVDGRQGVWSSGLRGWLCCSRTDCTARQGVWNLRLERVVSVIAGRTALHDKGLGVAGLRGRLCYSRKDCIQAWSMERMTSSM